DAKGSAADNANVKGTWSNGTWTVVWARPLDTGHPQDDKILKAGGAYTVGFAVHDDNITTRGHHVSFPVTIGLGVKADIQAVKLP
ncbi:MAG: ethylbenzene dehydrogenase-related protein, partial [Burkholderiales bacterium]|nr:ethylbenzene dehydrogenase-related protein [Burkholderiales bacterium]